MLTESVPESSGLIPTHSGSLSSAWILLIPCQDGRITMLSHQFGAFFGAWLGGLAVARFGDYGWMFFADALLALMAALVSLPVREAKVMRPAVA